MTTKLPDADDYFKLKDRFSVLKRVVFGTVEGKELLSLLEQRYVNCKLFQENDRDTVYAIAQRDLIIELKHMTEESEHE